MSREYIISVPDDAGFVEYSYIRGGRKYNTHYAYKSMGRLVRCGECKHENSCEHQVLLSTMWGEVEDTADIEYCSYGEREGE